MSSIEVAGHRLEVETAGPAPDEAPTLVFLHEGLGCVAAWRDFPRELAAACGFGLVTYSRRGYGASESRPAPWPLDYMHDEALRVLPALLDVTGVREAALVGHSDGASIALIYAGASRDPRVRALALIAPHVFVEPLSVDSINRAARDFDDPARRVRLARFHGPNTDDALEGWAGAWAHPDFLAWNIQGYVREIDAPVLVIQGFDDPYGTRAQVDAIASACRRRFEGHVFTSCGHSPHRDRAAETTAAMRRFLSVTLAGAARSA